MCVRWTDGGGRLTYPKGTTMEMVMAQRSMTIHRENRTPWQDVTSICNREKQKGWWIYVFWTKPVCCLKDSRSSSSHLALEAEDGDRKTHQSCDSQTQNHWFGVVKAGGREGSHIHCSGNAWMSWDQCVGHPRNQHACITICAYLDTNPIMKAMLKVWGEKYRNI